MLTLSRNKNLSLIMIKKTWIIFKVQEKANKYYKAKNKMN